MQDCCIVCGDENAKVIYETSNEKLARYGFLNSDNDSELNENKLHQKIVFCGICHFAWNKAFEYSKIKYDSDKIIEAGNFSKRYIEYQKSSAKNLKKIMGFLPDVAVEIGAGTGIFIKELEAKRKIAIEPSKEADRIDNSVEVYNQYYREEDFNIPANIVVMRQVLEHIQYPVEFLQQIKKSFNHGSNFYIYIEVPNSTLTFRFGRFYDYYYEHCNYFSVQTINFLANKLNMEIVDLSTAMDGELISFLLTNKKISPEEIKGKISKNQNKISDKLNSIESAGKKILAWGASGNGVNLLNKLKISKNLIPVVIDSDKNKQGKYIPGTLQKIISPIEAVDHKPDVILVLTQFHKNEIGELSLELFKNVEVWFID